MYLSKAKFKSGVKVHYIDDLDRDLLRKAAMLLKYKEDQDLIVVKQNKYSNVYKYYYKNKVYYLKKYYTPVKKLNDIIRPSRAFLCIKITKDLINKNIPVVSPILAISTTKLFCKNSIFITSEYPGETLFNYLIHSQDNQEKKKIIIKKLAYLWSSLYKSNYLHGDPTLHNILINHDQLPLNLSLVDVDGITYWPFLLENMVINNLAKFNAHCYCNLENYSENIITLDDRLLFLKEFINNYKIKKGFQELAECIREKTLDKLLKWGKEKLFYQTLK